MASEQRYESGNITKEGTTPATPIAGYRGIYPKNDGWYQKDSAGVESKFSTGSGASGKFGITDSAGAYTYYSTLQAALDALPAGGGTIEVFADVLVTTDTEVILPNKDITIIGNGHSYELNFNSASKAIKVITYTKRLNIFGYRILRTGANTSSGTLTVGGGNSVQTFINLKGSYISNINGATAFVCEGGTVRNAETYCGTTVGYAFFGTSSVIWQYCVNTIGNVGIGFYSGFAYYCYGRSTNNYAFNAVYLDTCWAYSNGTIAILGTGDGGANYRVTAYSFGSDAISVGQNIWIDSYAFSNAGSGFNVFSTSYEMKGCTSWSSSTYGLGGFKANGARCSLSHCFIYSSAAAALRITSGAALNLDNCVIKSTFNNAAGHAISFDSTAVTGDIPEIINCTLEVGNSGANAINAPIARTVKYTGNTYLNSPTTAIHANITQGITNTQDNQGNLKA